MVAQAQQTQTQVRKPRKATDAVCQQVRELNAAGVPRKTIMQITGLCESYISKICTGQMRAVKQTYRREMGLLDKQEHTYVYGETGEQIAVLDTEDAKQARIEILNAEKWEHEKRIVAINREIAELQQIPF